MKLITEKELKKHYRMLGGKSSELTRKAFSLKKGEILFVTREEWGLKIGPGQRVQNDSFNPRAVIRGMKFSWNSYLDGWAIKKL